MAATQPETVGQLLSSRRGSQERRRIGLVVQGGGMRGVYSMGGLAALEDAGLREAFDVVIGSSAGAINATYFLAGQAHDALSIYIDHLSNRRFINPLRLLRVVNIDFMVDGVMKPLFPIDVEALRDSRTLLKIVLTDASSAQAVCVTSRDRDLDIYEVIRATAALPGLYNKRVLVGGRPYVDGGVADTLPVLRTLDDGVDTLLGVATRRPGFRRRDAGPALRAVARVAMAGQTKAVRDAISREDRRFNKGMEILERPREHRPEVTVWSVFPSDPRHLVGRTTADKDQLRSCAEMGRRDMLTLLHQPLVAGDVSGGWRAS